MKKAPGVIMISHICVPKIMIRWCVVPEKWCTMDESTDEQMEKVTHRGRCTTYEEVELKTSKEVKTKPNS